MSSLDDQVQTLYRACHGSLSKEVLTACVKAGYKTIEDMLNKNVEEIISRAEIYLPNRISARHRRALLHIVSGKQVNNKRKLEVSVVTPMKKLKTTQVSPHPTEMKVNCDHVIYLGV
jgi:hypothetical protein